MNNVDVIKVIQKPGVKKRVVGYARVSTSDEHQDSSFRVQLDELEKYIRDNPSYEFIGMFKDRKSGTTTKHRNEFNVMIDLASAGEIDVIITKSITRFARNILDTISLVRSLKLNNVEIFFQKENISSLDPQMEFVLSVLAMHAEEESKNNSENTLWSIKKKLRAKGNFTTQLYGYKIKGEQWSIIESEAKIVRMLFDFYLEGKTYKHMIDVLSRMGVKSVTGKDRWHPGTIEQMLLNEKYAGHMALCKTYTHDGRSLRSGRLTKQENMIKNHHIPIVSPDIYDKAMKLRERRTKNKTDGYIPLSERITPYYQFVYSIENDNYLRYVVERPKGKYEIPTLYCYNQDRINRVMVKVSNLFSIINDAVITLKKSEINVSEIISDFISKSIQILDNVIDHTSDKITSISNRLIYVQSKKTLPNFIKKIKTFQPLDDISKIKQVVDYVNIDNNYHFHIKLSLIKNGQLNVPLLDSSINLKIGNIYKDVSYTLYI